MTLNPILELADRTSKVATKRDEEPWNIEKIINKLEYSHRITNSSIDAVCDYLEWRLNRIHDDVPSFDSLDSLSSDYQRNISHWIIGGKRWSRKLSRTHWIGLLNYHAARLFATPKIFARAAIVLAEIYKRIGMIHVALALCSKAIETLKERDQPELLVPCLIMITQYYRNWGSDGKALNCILVALPLAEKVSPKLRAQLWYEAAGILSSLKREDEAVLYYQKILELPESAELPIPNQSGIRKLGIQSKNLREYVHLILKGIESIAHGKLVHINCSDYVNLRPENTIRLTIEISHRDCKHFMASSYHELYDWLRRRAEKAMTIRESISWRDSAANYLRSWAPLLEELINTALMISLPHRALEWLELFKATIMIQRMRLNIGYCPEGVDQSEWSRLTELVQRYRVSLEIQDPLEKKGVFSGLNIQELEEAIRKIAGEISYKFPQSSNVLSIFTSSRDLPRFEALQKLLPPNTRIIEYFYTTNRGGCWIIDPHSHEEPIWINLQGLMKETVTQIAVEFADALGTWKQTRALFALNQVKNAITKAVDFARDTAIMPLHEHLNTETIDHLVVIPYRALNIVPFHAIFGKNDCQVTYVPSLRALSQLRNYEKTEYQRAIVATDSLPQCPSHLCNNPQGNKCWHLPGARVEGRHICGILESHGYSVTSAVGSNLTPSWLEKNLPHAEILHVSTHAIFNLAQPSQSGLMLALDNEENSSNRDSGLVNLRHDGKPTNSSDEAYSCLWTLQRLWQHADLSQCRLAFLAGCETSVINWEDVLEEFIGLPGGFLQAGVQTVIGSLWEVEDLSTLLFARRFYQNMLQKNCRPARALSETQSWLRSLTTQQIIEDESDILIKYYETQYGNISSSPQHALHALLPDSISPNDMPFNSPFYWASFRCIGLP